MCCTILFSLFKMVDYRFNLVYNSYGAYLKEYSRHLTQGLHLGCPTLGLLQTNGEISSNAGPKQYIWSALAKMSSLLSAAWDRLFTFFLLSFHTCQNRVVVSCYDTGCDTWCDIWLIPPDPSSSVCTGGSPPIQSLIRLVLLHILWRTLTNAIFFIFSLCSIIFKIIFNFLVFEIIIYNFLPTLPSI